MPMEEGVDNFELPDDVFKGHITKRVNNIKKALGILGATTPAILSIQ